jgi:hypothetical protein
MQLPEQEVQPTCMIEQLRNKQTGQQQQRTIQKVELEWKRGPEGKNRGNGGPTQRTSNLIDKNTSHHITHHIILPQDMHAIIYMGLH